MGFALDPQLALAMAPLAAAMDGYPPPAAGDWKTRRIALNEAYQQMGAQRPVHAQVTRTRFEAPMPDGAPLELRWYTPAATRADEPNDAPGPGGPGGPGGGPAVLYIHGGGMILGSVELSDPFVADWVATSGVPMLSAGYRLAPEHPHPTPVEDCYAVLVWLSQHAAELGVDPARIAVMGDSAGGGLAAGVALIARDRGGPVLARQILIYPMLDDRNTITDPGIAPFATWTYDDNITGWGALLGAAAGGDDVPAYAAPARADDLTGLPPAYLDVGQLDAFRDETLSYALRLSQAGVPVELHLHPGVPHGFELFAPEADVSIRAESDRMRAVRSL